MTPPAVPSAAPCPGGVTVTTGYDDVGRVASRSGMGADVSTADRTFTYDHGGRMLTAATSAAGSAPATGETFTVSKAHSRGRTVPPTDPRPPGQVAVAGLALWAAGTCFGARYGHRAWIARRLLRT